MFSVHPFSILNKSWVYKIILYKQICNWERKSGREGVRKTFGILHENLIHIRSNISLEFLSYINFTINIKVRSTRYSIRVRNLIIDLFKVLKTQ